MSVQLTNTLASAGLTACGHTHIHTHTQPKPKKQLAPVPPEPDASHPDAVQVVVRLADGTRLTRRFLRTDRVEVCDETGTPRRSFRARC